VQGSHAAVAQARLESLADCLESAGQPVAPRTARLGHLGAPPATAVHYRCANADQRAGRNAARHEVVADRDEDLRLICLEGEGDHAITELGAKRAGEALQLLHRVKRRGVGHETCSVNGLRASRELPRLSRAAAAGAQTPLQFLVLAV
jgi:hypothetical protein